jgi:3',5'-cyclic AMP phosphodiesterase CpdA
MRIAVLSDLHICASYPETFARALQAFRCVREKDVDHIVVAGDVFDSFSDFERDAGRLRKELMALGLWQPAKLTVLPGNHDLFSFSEHRWSKTNALGKAAYVAKVPWALKHAVGIDGERRKFGTWASDLLLGASLRDGHVAPFDKRVGSVRLLGLDTTPNDLSRFSIGTWPSDHAMTLRNALSGTQRTDVRNVLVMHHPPFRSEPPASAVFKASGWAEMKDEFYRPRGFVERDIAEIERFVTDARVEAIVCGHVHSGGKREWTVGAANVFLEGRTGGVHQPDERSQFGVLDVSSKGPIQYLSYWV